MKNVPDGYEVFSGFVPDDYDRKPLIGWFWWACHPGCLPDGEPFGPFDTEAEAVQDCIDIVAEDIEIEARLAKEARC